MPHVRMARRRYDPLAVILLVCILVIGSGSVAASPQVVRAAVPITGAVVTLSLPTVTAGAVEVVTGYHFQPGERVALQLGAASGVASSYRTLLYATAAANGTFRVSLTIPTTTAAGAYLLRAVGLTSHGVGSTRVSVAAPTPVVTVSLPTITAGKADVVTGYHFQPGERVALQLGAASGVASSYRTLLYAIAAANGTFRVSLTIPTTTAAGAYLLRAVGLTSHGVGSARVSVMAPKAPVPAPRLTISIRPTRISPGQFVSVAGTGFHPYEVLTIAISTPSGSAAASLGQAQANATGAFSVPALRVPYGIAPGRQLVVVTGHSSNRQASTAVNVVVQLATLTVSPHTVQPGGDIRIQVAHFEPNEAVTIDLVTLTGTKRIGTVRANSDGGFLLPRVGVPLSTPNGAITVVATGTTSHLSATVQVTSVSLQATLALSVGRAVPGQAITIAGHGFIAGEAISVSLSSAVVRVGLVTVVANTLGAFTVSNVVVPAFLPAATYTINATGQASGRAASRSLVVVVQHVAVPSLSIIGATAVAGAYQVNPGGLLQVAGSGFPVGAVVTFRLAGPRMITLSSGRVSSTGVVGPLGVTVPATTPAGSYALQALVSGRALATTQVRVAMLAPHLSLSSGSLSPGAVVTVQGSGYAVHEQIVLALNGMALLTTPSTVITNGAGQFTASFSVPQTVTSGTNVLIATGATSRVSATVSVSANLPVASRWYFVNGDTTNGRSTTISILNPNNAVTTVKMTFLYQASSEQHYTQLVSAHALSLIDLGQVAGSGRVISTILEADHQVSAESTVTYPGGDDAMATGATGPATRWYLAEGYTNSTFSETIHVMNPNSTYATVDVQFLPFNNQPVHETRFVMLPDSNIQIDAGQYMPNQSISAIVSADKPIVVERSMHFGLHGRGAHDNIGTTTLSTVWVFAQGESAGDRQTFFTILNPNQAASAAVTATFFNAAGQPVGARTIVVAPLHRGNIKLNDVLPNAQVATILTSNVPVAVERPFYQGPASLSQATSGSVIFGRNGAGISWSFPAGSTLGGNQTTLYLFNPGLQTVRITATLYTDGGAAVSQTLTIAPNSDLTLNAASVPGMPAARFGAVLRSTNGQPFIAEESIQNGAAQTYDSTEGVAQ